jgi:alpha-glucosidase
MHKTMRRTAILVSSATLSAILLATTPSDAAPASSGSATCTPRTPGRIVKFANPSAHEYTLTTDSPILLKLSFVRPDVFRIQAAPDGKFADPKNNPQLAQIVIAEPSYNVPVSASETGNDITFTTTALVLRVRKQDCRWDLADANGTAIWQESKPLCFDGKSTVQTLSTSPNEFFFGGGQQNGYFSHKGRNIAIEADGNWGEGGHPNPAPFYLSNRGYGVLRNTFAVGDYDFTSNETIALAHAENRFDAYYFVGATFHRVVDLYTQFTGRPNFVPLWALELGEADAYMARDPKTKEPRKDAQGNPVKITPDVIARLAEQYRKHDMPAGWISPNDGYGCGYVELERVVKGLAALGFYTGLWTENGLRNAKWEVAIAGTRLRKLDVAWTGPAYQFSLDANRQAWQSLVDNSDSRGFVWTVQGWAGTQRYSVCWTGDQYGSWDLIRYHIPTLIGSGMSGQAYATTDVDGIFGGSPETYTRDLQWKCFTPVLYAMNGWAGKMNKSPWSYDEPYRSINRMYLKLKMRLMPYMYRYAQEAYQSGAPIVRGMIWNFPDDRKTWGNSTQYQYMLGDWLLVAPVYTSMKLNRGWRKEHIYLPAGQWIDYWDGRRLEGPTSINAYPVTLEKLPLLVRAGAIIPMYPEMLYNNQKPKDPLTLDIYPYGRSSFELYEDDGLTREYQKGALAKQLISVAAPPGKAGDIDINVGKSVGQFAGKLPSRVYEFLIHSELKPRAVTVNGEPLLELMHPEAYPAAVAAWYFDPGDRRGIVHVRLARRPTDQEFSLHLDIDRNLMIAASPPYPTPVVTAELDPLEFTITTNSQQPHTLSQAFDGTPETFWHSYYGKDPKAGQATEPPYIVDIGLNGLYPLKGFSYQARQDLGNGLIDAFELYVSRSKDELGKPVCEGHFQPIKEVQTVTFPTTWGAYVRLKILNAHHRAKFASAAEFGVIRDLAAAPLPDQVVYLSDSEPATAQGVYRKDASAAGHPLTVNGQVFKKGLGVKADSVLVYKLDGSWDRLSGHVGVDGEVGAGGHVMFRVYADGKRIFESPQQSVTSIKQLMDLDIKGIKQLKLVLLDDHGPTDSDHGDWLDARLIRKGSPK